MQYPSSTRFASLTPPSHPNFASILGHPQFPPRAGHSATLVGSRLFVIGGRSTTACYNDVWIFDCDSEAWEELTDAAPFSPRSYHSATLVNGRDIWVVGGSDSSEMHADVHVLNTQTCTVLLPISKPEQLAHACDC